MNGRSMLMENTEPNRLPTQSGQKVLTVLRSFQTGNVRMSVAAPDGRNVPIARPKNVVLAPIPDASQLRAGDGDRDRRHEASDAAFAINFSMDRSSRALNVIVEMRPYGSMNTVVGYP